MIWFFEGFQLLLYTFGGRTSMEFMRGKDGQAEDVLGIRYRVPTLDPEKDDEMGKESGGVNAQILEHLSQSADHPVALTFPEGAYLKGLVCLKVK
jgi:hypothetical protein